MINKMRSHSRISEGLHPSLAYIAHAGECHLVKKSHRILHNITRSGFYKLSFHYFYINGIRSGLRKA